MKSSSDTRPCLFIGLDWGDRQHALCLLWPDGSRELTSLEHTPEAIAKWIALVKRRAKDQRILIALEQSRGAVMNALEGFEGIELYPINPKQLARYQSANDYAVAWVVQHSLGGHAIPLDAPNLRTLRRLAVLEETGGKDDFEALRATLEHLVPKVKGLQFVDLVSIVAEEACFETDPNCPRCPMLSVCPTGQEVKAAVATSGKKSR